jgi:dehydrogenase/reductase SDR family member 12
MPETTETTTLSRTPEDVFAALADFSKLADWDPMFDRSERLDSGPIGIGSRFRAVGTAAGSEIDLELEIVEYEAPRRVVLHGTGDGMSTREAIRVEAEDDGASLVTYTSSFETDKPDLVDAMTKPAFVLVGKRAISGMRDWFAE